MGAGVGDPAICSIPNGTFHREKNFQILQMRAEKCNIRTITAKAPNSLPGIVVDTLRVMSVGNPFKARPCLELKPQQPGADLKGCVAVSPQRGPPQAAICNNNCEEIANVLCVNAEALDLGLLWALDLYSVRGCKGTDRGDPWRTRSPDLNELQQ